MRFPQLEDMRMYVTRRRARRQLSSYNSSVEGGRGSAADFRSPRLPGHRSVTSCRSDSRVVTESACSSVISTTGLAH